MNNKTIYQILSEYTKEEIDKVIETLDSKDKNLLYLRYGHDLFNPNSSNWSMDYHTEFYKKLLPKLRRRLEKIREGEKVPFKINGLLLGHKSKSISPNSTRSLFKYLQNGKFHSIGSSWVIPNK